MRSRDVPVTATFTLPQFAGVAVARGGEEEEAMRRRIVLILAMVGLGLGLLTTPVVAAPGQNPGQHGQNCISGQGCPGPH